MAGSKGIFAKDLVVHSRSIFQPYSSLDRLSQLPRSTCWYRTATSTIYERLDHTKNHIRVIKIHPGRWDDEILCRLKIISLDRLPRARYNVLSYTWGNSQDTRPIKVDNLDIDISVNLFIALRALRGRFRTVTVWADALCIDQKNNHEKSKQVALMGRIYKEARQTWVSLGCPDEKWADGTWLAAPHLPEKARLVKYVLRGMWRLYWHHIALWRSRRSRLGVNHTFDALRLMRGAAFEPRVDDALQQHQHTAASMLTWLATHDYWTRVWIVQEIALSRFDPICIFGKHQIPLKSLDTILEDWCGGFVSTGTTMSERIDYGFRAKSPDRVFWSKDIDNGITRAREICMLREEFLPLWTEFLPMWILPLKGRMEMLRAFQFTSYRRASVAHDYVYGIRSLLPTKEQSVLDPDYDLSVRELYASVTKLFLQSGYSPDVLCAAIGTSGDNDHELPSWSIDFSKPLRLPKELDTMEETRHLRLKSLSEYEVLYLQGSYTGEQIVGCVPNDDLHGIHPVFSNFLTRDIYKAGWRGKSRYAPDLDQGGRRGLNSSYNERHMDEAINLTRDFKDTTNTVFMTDQMTIGKCANEVQQGDEIWTLTGSRTRFVLRPILRAEGDAQMAGRYRLVGPCDLFRVAKDNIHIAGEVARSIEIV